VRHALEELGRITAITEINTYDPRPLATHAHRGAEYPHELVRKMKIEFIVPANQVSNAIAIIRKAALTGHHGDGTICIMPVDQVVQIRTGEIDVEESSR
jgi:nitrogen regulatory protein PII